jgi:hypothetical protein
VDKILLQAKIQQNDEKYYNSDLDIIYMILVNLDYVTQINFKNICKHM